MTTKPLLLCASLLIGLGATPLLLVAETRSEQKARAKEATIKALAAEAQGDLESRAKLLKEATQLDPQSAAQSQLGKVRSKSGWLTIDEAADKIKDANAMERYAALREGMADTAVAHLQMSQRCTAAKLPDQARAHMNRVMELDPENELARTTLGYKKINGIWVSPEQIAAEEAQAAAEAAAIAKYGKQMRAIREDLNSKDKRQQAKGKNELLDLRDPESILAAEKILSPANEAIALVVLEYLANIQDPVATLSLARHAVYYPSSEVRTDAALKLADRNLHDYAPPLLNLLSGPVEASLQPVFARDGRMIGTRQVFAREGKDQNQLVVMDSELIRGTAVVAAPGSPAAEAERRARGRTNPLESIAGQMLQERENQELDNLANLGSMMEGKSREEQVKIQNMLITQTNQRVMNVLSIATGEELSPNPQTWWNWYDDVIGVQSQNNKYTNASRNYRQYVSAGRNPYEVSDLGQGIGTSIRTGDGGPIRAECFVAGTLVTTHRGPIAIETVKVGDMVLTKNVTSGALEFKPALQATTRPIEELTIIRTDKDTFQCTRGHFFWVSGSGWLKAEDLKPGMVLHAAENPVKITEVKKGGKAVTHNLRIGDNANYFVGTGRILSHDVTALTPTREAIPGYVAAK